MTVQPTVLYDDVNGRADTIVSGEWQHTDPDDYASPHKLGYAATLFRSGWWSGGCSPIVTREVAERMVTDQAALVAEHSPDKPEAFGTLTWDGDVLVYRLDGDEQRVEATPDGYDVGFGWTWYPVAREECVEVVGDPHRVVTARFTVPQSILDKHGEEHVLGVVQDTLDAIRHTAVGLDYVTPYVEVTVA